MPQAPMVFPPGFPTPEQARIVAHDRGPLLVLATVGSGKTTTLTARVGRLLAGGDDPARVIGLTFTNRAAENLRGALHGLGLAARDITVRTFHGFCAWFLRQEGGAVGLPRDFWIFDEDDAAALGWVLAGAGV